MIQIEVCRPGRSTQRTFPICVRSPQVLLEDLESMLEIEIHIFTSDAILIKSLSMRIQWRYHFQDRDAMVILPLGWLEPKQINAILIT